MLSTRLCLRLAPLLLLAPLAVGRITPAALPCSAFLITGDGRVLMGNNEDFWDHRTMLWFQPEEQGRYGSIFLGYTNLFPQGGMNTAGLAFDGFATGSFPLVEQEGKPAFEGSAGNLIEEVMATCASVAEVRELVSRYDLSWMHTAMLLFADKHGDSVILEGDKFVAKQGDYQVVTNFYQSKQENDRAMCRRYAAAVDVLDQRTDVSLELCTTALAAAAQHKGTPTQYSNVFDLQAGVLYLYHFHNFDEVVVLDLAEELSKGPSSVEIPSLFTPTEAYKSFVAERQASIDKRVLARRGPQASAAELERCVGTYSVSIPGSPDVELRVDRRQNNLVMLVDGWDQEQVLVCEAPGKFFRIDFGGEKGLHFRGDPGAPYQRCTVRAKTGISYEARRID